MSDTTEHVASPDSWSEIECSTQLVTLQNIGPHDVRLYIGSAFTGAANMMLWTRTSPASFTLDPGDSVYIRRVASELQLGETKVAKWE